MNKMKVSRLNRIFEPGSSRFLGVAIEEGFFDSYDVLSGVHILQALMEASPNAVQVNPSQAATWQAVSTADCALIINVEEFCLAKEFDPIEQALRLDAAGVRIKLDSLTQKPDGSTLLSRQMARLRDSCERYGMPLIIELPVSKSAISQSVKIRQAAAFGADVIQVSAEDEHLSYDAMTECAAGVPLVVSDLGGGSDRAVLKQAEALVKSGMQGLVLNRTAFESAALPPITKALKAIMHQGTNAAEISKK